MSDNLRERVNRYGAALAEILPLIRWNFDNPAIDSVGMAKLEAATGLLVEQITIVDPDFDIDPLIHLYEILRFRKPTEEWRDRSRVDRAKG